MTLRLMHTSYGLIPFGVAAAFLVIASSARIGVVVDLCERRKKVRASRWFYFTGLLTFVSIICFFLLANIQNFITDYRAERIIQGLNDYRSEKGYYPPNLNPLTRQYLRSIPPTAYGVLRQDFQHSSYSSGGYQLFYHSYFGVEHT